MEVAMEQMINQMNHFNLHIPQAKAKSAEIWKRFVNSSMLQVLRDETLFKKMWIFILESFLQKRNVKFKFYLFLPKDQIPMALMKKEILIIIFLTLMEQKLVKDVILKKNVFKMCGKHFVLTEDHLAKKVYP
jgi:hypothetical protein